MIEHKADFLQSIEAVLIEFAGEPAQKIFRESRKAVNALFNALGYRQKTAKESRIPEDFEIVDDSPPRLSPDEWEIVDIAIEIYRQKDAKTVVETFNIQPEDHARVVKLLARYFPKK